MDSKVVRRVWGLESGFKTENAERDEWFKRNPVFLAMHNKTTGHLKFTSLAYAYIEEKVKDGISLPHTVDAWETTAAKEIEKSDDGTYRCYETASGSRYHLYQVGQLRLF